VIITPILRVGPSQNAFSLKYEISERPAGWAFLAS
jgi:hypothetical protein